MNVMVNYEYNALIIEFIKGEKLELYASPIVYHFSVTSIYPFAFVFAKAYPVQIPTQFHKILDSNVLGNNKK